MLPLYRRPREGGDPVSFGATTLDSRLRGNDEFVVPVARSAHRDPSSGAAKSDPALRRGDDANGRSRLRGNDEFVVPVGRNADRDPSFGVANLGPGLRRGDDG